MMRMRNVIYNRPPWLGWENLKKRFRRGEMVNLLWDHNMPGTVALSRDGRLLAVDPKTKLSSVMPSPQVLLLVRAMYSRSDPSFAKRK